MRRSVIAAAGLLAATPAFALFGGSGSGSSGGDREPAGGAFMSNYTYPGSTGVQQGVPPRSVDIPQNGYGYYGAPAYGYEQAPARRMHRRRGE